ncbi:MAG: hypothetical protein WC849_00835 [Candidatus Paceibacterota bacterium]
MSKKDRIKNNEVFNMDEANYEYLRNGDIDGLKKNEMKKIIIYAVIFFILGFTVSTIFFGGDKGTLNSKDEQKSEEIVNNQEPQQITTSVGDSISVKNQPFGNIVVISELELKETVWVTIYESLEDGELGNILGAGVFDKGSYKNASIELLRGTEGESKYYVKLLKDDGDRTFDHTKDLPVKNIATKKDLITTFKTTSGMPR